MFSRSSSYVFTASKAELKKTGVRYTAQSKKNRINVQLLKDFPGVGIKGQVVAVKPSAMSNKLHPFNGAAAAAAALAALKNAQKESKKTKKVKLNPILKSELEKSKKADDLLSLDDLLAIDLNALSKDNLDLVFSKLPKKLIMVKRSKDKVLSSPLQKSFVTQQIELSLAKYIREAEIAVKFFNNQNTAITLKSESGEPLEAIDKLGTYYAEVTHEDREQPITIVVNSNN
ncbi:hypothetical protein PMKS-003004 [Pichia membranifaciens]|uniref:Ribosomal protein L9 domain-containing protein n=1 Tax=Pichia membranifaciens TaxID=4926 RepID=A0A1Q2YJF3_9ASCO|nr:hypothetical protein PMKS-003004 [Pichia membranifaciens]